MPSLPSVVNNVQTLFELLTSDRSWRLPAANCARILNPSSTSAVLNQIHEAARQAESALLIYFAGHGLLDGGSGDLHLALSNSSLDRMHDAIPFALIRREVVTTAIRCPAKVVLIDSCYSGAAMSGFMGGTPSVADLAVTDGAYIMTASGEQAKAVAPQGARYTAFTGALVNAMRGGVPGGPAMLDMDTLYDQVMLDLRAQHLPLPQCRSRNDGHRIVLAHNSVTKQHNSVTKQQNTAKKQKIATNPAKTAAVTAADLGAIRGALIASAQGSPFVAKSKAGEVIREVCPHIPAANWAGSKSLGRFVDVHLPELRPRAGDPEDHLRVRGGTVSKPKPAAKAKAEPPPTPKNSTPKNSTPKKKPTARTGRRDIDKARTAIRAALLEQSLLPVELAASLLIREVPTIYESSWAGAGTCKLFLAKYLPDFPYTQNRTGGFIEAPRPFPRNVLGALRRRISARRLRNISVATALVVSLGYAGQKVKGLADNSDVTDPTLTVTQPAEGRLTQERYTIQVSRTAPAGQQIIAMVRESAADDPAKWSFYRCVSARSGTQCKTVPIGKKGSGKRMQVAIVSVNQAQGRQLLDAEPSLDFRGAPADLKAVAVSRTYQYQR